MTKELIERLRSFEVDHQPDGWPAIKMRDVSALLDALEQAQADYQAACNLVANMHEAAVGAKVGPKQGVVEDIINLREERDALQAKNKVLLDAAQAVVDRWETPLWKDVPSTAEYIYRLRDAIIKNYPERIKDLRGVSTAQAADSVQRPAAHTTGETVGHPALDLSKLNLVDAAQHCLSIDQYSTFMSILENDAPAFERMESYLEMVISGNYPERINEAPAEPVAWLITAPNVMPLVQVHKPISVLSNETVQPLYTQPQREPLTDQEMLEVFRKTFPSGPYIHNGDATKFARMVEQAHGIKESV
jgi:hypothetical protein